MRSVTAPPPAVRILTVLLLAGLSACQRPEVTPGITRVPASADALERAAIAGPPSQPGASVPDAPVPLRTQYAPALDLLARYQGLYLARVEGQQAVLWIDRGTTLRRGDEAVTLPRLQLYRASRAGSPQVLADLRPEQQHGPQVHRFCAFSQGQQELPDASCDAAQRLVLAADAAPGQSGTIDQLTSRLDVQGSQGEVVTWLRTVDAPGPAGEPARNDVAWFDALVLRSALPQGAPQRRGDIAWQPMQHVASGVEWDRPVALPDAQVLARVQREADRRAAIFVAQALEAQARGHQAQALIRVRHASPRWLVMEASTSVVASDGAQARERHAVWDLASGTLVRFADGFHYATLKRLDGSIALDLERVPADGDADADRGLLGAALRALGPRRSARCLQRWLQAHRCQLPSACEALARVPDDLVLWPGEDGLVLQFDHAITEAAAKESGRGLPASLRGPAWASCVSDQVTLPWAVALQARRRDSRIELP